MLSLGLVAFAAATPASVIADFEALTEVSVLISVSAFRPASPTVVEAMPIDRSAVNLDKVVMPALVTLVLSSLSHDSLGRAASGGRPASVIAVLSSHRVCSCVFAAS